MAEWEFGLLVVDDCLHSDEVESQTYDFKSIVGSKCQLAIASLVPGLAKMQ